MTRVFLCSCVLVVAAALVRSASDDEPALAGKKAGEWLQLLQDTQAPVGKRRAAALALGRIGTRFPRAVPALITALQKDADADIRRTAAQALGQLGTGDAKGTAREAVDALAEALKGDASEAVRWTAA